MTDTLWLVRHAHREDFADESWRATAERPHDPDLSPEGVRQADCTADALRGAGIAGIYVSPFLRTVHTAARVAAVLRLPVHLEAGLGEWMNADWFAKRPEILPAEVLAERFPGLDARVAPPAPVPYPESLREVHERAARTARTLAAEADGPLLLVSHGAVVIGAIEGLTGHATRLDGYPLCGLTKLRRSAEGAGSNAWRAEELARTDHLNGDAHAADRLH